MDTGSNVSILKPGVSSSDIKVSTLKPFGVTGETLDVKGRQTVTFALGGKEFKHTILVCQLPTDAAGLIGADFLEVAGAIVNFESCELLIPHGRYHPRARDDALDEHTALTVFTKGKEESSLQSLQPEAMQRIEQITDNPPREAPTPLRSWLVKASENIVLAPHCRQVVQGRLELESEYSFPPLVIVEPAHIPIEGIFPDRALTRIEPSARQSSRLTSPVSSSVSQRADRAYVMLTNFSGELNVPKVTVLGVAEEVS